MRSASAAAQADATSGATSTADYGGYEGMTEEQIRKVRPGWYLWRDGVIPGGASHPGETLQQVAARTDAVLDRVRPLLNDGDVALVAHGHLQRVLTVRWLGLDPSAGRLLRHPHPGTLSALGTEDVPGGHLRLEHPLAAARHVPGSRCPTAPAAGQVRTKLAQLGASS
jgi:broad specificity phosphatase PhoE